MAFRVVKELENGLMEIIMKEILKMAFNKAKGLLSVKKELGLTLVNGNKEKWMVMVCVNGQTELNIVVNGVTVLRMVKVFWIILMTRCIQEIFHKIFQMVMVKKHF